MSRGWMLQRNNYILFCKDENEHKTNIPDSSFQNKDHGSNSVDSRWHVLKIILFCVLTQKEFDYKAKVHM